ncbi:Vacuolar protein sorting-associated protein VTA1 [Galdieria sulphuraria]|uniref:Vacuolar protein sorting-associated protein VTA1 n=1 Tax=Galdieria sulphuraria TaxID=130081 RepID=M2XX74_GALSU|nr:vacuolar protein sorting-associated protein VTA1 [Galdieria sulphuraria]EME28228.1 vacuolar protein sorting-associated protein VTA1 [Galdieria sulphuraria]GJD11055.1 Vacuolar protein sorting-associated protein VTA1 [Galdieria sulphuraria]|eukprot:XP_005704748.1 vacuolar protein sorting-associated protein VTA1 [Galdieria sulphuraria]
MSASWPTSLKPLAKYLVRAKEVEQIDPLVAYACRFYACEFGLKLRDKKDPDASKFMKSLIEKCEQDKAKLGDTTLLKEHLEEFALKVFLRADTEDRNGNATRTTVRTFYAALCFLEVLNSLGEPSEDIRQKMKYCKFKVAYISKCLREGIQPVPGPPDSQTESKYEDTTRHDLSLIMQEPGESNSPETNIKELDDSLMERNTSEDSTNQVEENSDESKVDVVERNNLNPTANDTERISEDVVDNHLTETHTTASTNTKNKYDLVQSILEAQKHAKNASSALDFQDVNSAIKELEDALSLLKQCK